MTRYLREGDGRPQGLRPRSALAVLCVLSACHSTKDGPRPVSTPEIAEKTAQRYPATPVHSGPSTPAPRTYRFVGRSVTDPDGGLRFAWSGSRLEARFTGDARDLELDDDGFNTFGVVLDGKTDRLEALPELAVNRHRHLAHHSPHLPGKTGEHILPECLDGERNP